MAARRVTQAGFTLIEVMIAMLLTAIAVMGIMALYLVEMRSGTTSRHTTEAAVLAEDKMEVIRTELTPAGGSETGLDSLGQAGGIFNRTWTATTSGAYVSYNVTVAWDEDGTPKKVVLRSMRNL